MCNCNWSRQVSSYCCCCIRHCCNKLFFVIIRVLVVVNQIFIIPPFICFKNSMASTTAENNSPTMLKTVAWKFRTHGFVTAMSILLITLYTIISPFVVTISSQLYSTTRRRNQDNSLFVNIAKFIMGFNVLCVLLTMIANIWHRKVIVKILNLLNELLLRFQQFNEILCDFKTFLALIMKLIFTLYDIFASLPFLFTAASRLSTQSILAFLFVKYLQGMLSIFNLNIFVFILLFLLCSMHLEKALQSTNHDLHASDLIALQNSLQHVIAMFRKTFQFGIFLSILLHFVAILSNIYAVLDFYATTHRIFSTFIIFILSMAFDMYSLILVTFLCDRSQRKVKDLFLFSEELSAFKLTNSSVSLVEYDLLWPQLHEFQIFGLYTVNHELALFIVTYSINFIIIILEFELNKTHIKK